MQKEKFERIIESMGDFFGVLSHPDRIKILVLLQEKEMDVNEIHNAIDISQPRVSQHLRALKFSDIVEERREGKHVYYHIKNPDISRIMNKVLQLQMMGSITTDPDKMNILNEFFAYWHKLQA